MFFYERQFNSMSISKDIKILCAAYREIENVDRRATRTAIDQIIMTHQTVNRMILLVANCTKEQAILCVSYSYRLASRGYDENSSWTFICRFKRKDGLIRKVYAMSFNATSL